jgi:hypothetical protein
MVFKVYTRRRRKSARRMVPIYIIVVAALVIVIGGSLAIGTGTQRTGTLPAPAKEAAAVAVNTVPPEMDEPTDASSQVKEKWYGLCAKNSVRSVEDLRRIVESDPILAKHYADFDWSRAKLEKLQKPASVHLAYRKDEVIRYTTRRINLPSGEHYVTDGNRNIRVFCCNDFVDAPPRAQSDSVPQSMPTTPPPFTDRLDTDPPKGLARPMTSMQPRSEGPPPHPPLYHASPAGGSPGGPARYSTQDPPQHVAVPEPGTILLFGGGIFGICIMEMIRRRRK